MCGLLPSLHLPVQSARLSFVCFTHVTVLTTAAFSAGLSVTSYSLLVPLITHFLYLSASFVDLAQGGFNMKSVVIISQPEYWLVLTFLLPNRIVHYF